MKENENKKPSKTAGAARQGGDTNNKVMGSPVSTAVGEPVATEQAQPYAYEQDNGCDTDLIYAAWFAHGLGKMAPDCIYRPLYLEPVAVRLAAPTQAKPVDLSGLTRHDSFETDEGDELRVEPTGCWVQFDDVERLLAAPTQVSAPQADEEVLMALIELYGLIVSKGWPVPDDSYHLMTNAAQLIEKRIGVAPAPAEQASAAQEVLHEDVEWLLEAVDMARHNPEHATKIRANCKAGAAQEVRAVRLFDKSDVIKAWACVRKNNQSIPDDALDEMRDVMLASLTPASTSTAPAAMDEGDAK